MASHSSGQKNKPPVGFLSDTMKGVLVGGIIGLLSTAMTLYHQTVTARLERADRQKQTLQEAFSQLEGGKAKIRELLILYHDSQIHCHYWYGKWKRDGSPESRAESNRQSIRAEDFRAEIARTNPDVFGALATIETYCGKNEKIMKLVEKARSAVDLKVPLYPTDSDSATLEDWKYKMTSLEAATVDANYSRPMNDLLTAVREEVAR